MKEAFKQINFRADTMRLIEIANDICTEYQNQGFTLTVRQLYYQFVARDIIPNKQSEYKRLAGIINDARLAGLIDWDAIEDRTRNLEKLAHWDSKKDIVEACAKQFRYDRWLKQPLRCEVWVEKEALVGVIEGICNQYRVPFFACRGYASQSEKYAAAKRFASYAEDGQGTIIFHLGDHDPSGLDMTRDNQDSINLFWDGDAHPEYVEVRRLALNMDQVRRYNPPPNPAKMTDSRFGGYASKFGQKSWELDALEPQVIAQLIRVNVESIIDVGYWDDAVAAEEKARKDILAIASKMKEDD